MEEAREAIFGYAMSHPIPKTCVCQFNPAAPYEFISSTCPPPISCPTSSTSTPLTLPYTGHYLPCPDMDGDDPQPGFDNDGVDGLTDINNGVEDRRSGTPAVCAASSGHLPWVTLGTAAQDAWGNRLNYALTVSYGDPANGFSNADSGDLQICSTSVGGCISGTVASNVPVVLVSYGPNGWGGRNVNNTTLAMPTSADEIENINSNLSYITRSPSKPGTALGEFDDLVVWISKPLLLSRVCPAGGCP